MSAKPRPRSASRLRSAAPSSSEVEPRSVAKRQCSTISPSRTAPKWVCVLPTSTTRSTRGLCGAERQGGGPARRTPSSKRSTASASASRSPAGVASVEVELEQRDQHEAPREHLLVGQRRRSERYSSVAEQQHVDVDRARAVARAAGGAAELALERLAGVEQLARARAPSRSAGRR